MGDGCLYTPLSRVGNHHEAHGHVGQEALTTQDVLTVFTALGLSRSCSDKSTASAKGKNKTKQIHQAPSPRVGSPVGTLSKFSQELLRETTDKRDIMYEKGSRRRSLV